MSSLLLSHRLVPATALLLVVAIVCTPYITASGKTVLENGNVFENIEYTEEITYDANAKLKDEKSYSSFILWKKCKVSSKVTVEGTFDINKDFPTSLYFMVEQTSFTGVGQFDFFDLPPNSYIHAVGTTATMVTQTIYNIRPITETNNITAFIDDSSISYKSGDVVFVNLEVPIGSPYIVTHMRDADLYNTYAIFETATCSDGSTIFLEKIVCTECRYDLVWLDEVTSIERQSALILKEIRVVDHEYPTRDGLIVTGSVVEVDETSVLAMVDIDLTNNFEAEVPLRLFYNTELTGDGAIVLLRIMMGTSGLDDRQPEYNDNFWVVAKKKPTKEMTTLELRLAKFNVNSENVIHWDGTDADGDCVEAGLALPNTATYELVGDRCEATCPKGNFLQPACTPRAVCTGVPNCEACFAHPKTKCLECLPHTTPVDENTRCQCPIRECITCPTATLCSECSSPDHIFSAELNACFHCKIPRCTDCKEDGKCATCQAGYKVYNNECIACTIDKCESCKEPGKCAECSGDYTPNLSGDKCVRCEITGCKECNTDNVCNDCLDGYTYTPADKKCVRCGVDVPNCKTCKVASVCSDCDANHKPANEGKDCFHCTIPSCKECSADGVCGDCDDGYSLVESSNKPTDNKCVRCTLDVQKCKTCEEEGKCSECIADHKPANEGKDCFHCTISSCKECSADGVCGDCNDGYSLVESSNKPTDNKCVRCTLDVQKCKTCEEEGKCSECIADHKPANEGKDCFHCTISGCKECSDDGVCEDCEDGYSLEGNKCVGCAMDVEHCKSCKEEGVCSECIDDYKPANKGKNCFHCTIPGCNECSTDGVCSDCADGYSLVESSTKPTDNKCVRCTLDVENCKTCEEEGVCSECAADHKPANEGKDCFHCTMPSCKECSAHGVCGECDDGYSLVDSENTCVPCSIEIPDCKSCQAAGVCSECMGDYKLSSDGRRCSSCDFNDCQRCDVPEACTLCNDGMAINTDGECVTCTVEDCTQCSDANVCALCTCGLVPSGDGKTCVSCGAANCKHCDPTGAGSTCAECHDGYDVSSSGLCKKVTMPDWVICIIVMIVSILLMATAVVLYLMYLRRMARIAQVEADAQERRRNRQAQSKAGRHRTEILVVDLGDIEGAASGVRDTLKTDRV